MEIKLTERVGLAIKTFQSKYEGKEKLNLNISPEEQSIHDYLKHVDTGRAWEVEPFHKIRLAIRDLFFCESAKETLSRIVSEKKDVISFGSGFSTLDLMNEGAYETFTNVDFFDVNLAKKVIYEKLGLMTDNIHFDNTNINETPISDITSDKNNVLAILEGITYYLTPEKNQEIFNETQKNDGSVILDYFIKGMDNGTTQYSEANKIAKVLKDAGDTIKSVYTPEKMNENLNKFGITCHKSITDVVSKYGQHQEPWVYFVSADSRLLNK